MIDQNRTEEPASSSSRRLLIIIAIGTVGVLVLYLVFHEAEKKRYAEQNLRVHIRRAGPGDRVAPLPGKMMFFVAVSNSGNRAVENVRVDCRFKIDEEQIGKKEGTIDTVKAGGSGSTGIGFSVPPMSPRARVRVVATIAGFSFQ